MPRAGSLAGARGISVRATRSLGGVIYLQLGVTVSVSFCDAVSRNLVLDLHLPDEFLWPRLCDAGSSSSHAMLANWNTSLNLRKGGDLLIRFVNVQPRLTTPTGVHSTDT